MEQDWLLSHHTFSFGSYYDPKRMHFGCLRVLNDDYIQPAKGFGTHSHSNMEIVTVPISGSLAHKDSKGNEHVVTPGEVQVMSAGTGISHSEVNPSSSEVANLLQIWILPGKKEVEPRYDQKAFEAQKFDNKLATVVGPQGTDGLWIHQNAYFSLGKFSEGQEVQYPLRSKDNGIYLFVMSGTVSCDGETLQNRDGLGLTEVETLPLRIQRDSHLLLMEVPLR